MSSVDLHGQYSYQALLPEAIAIVVAPRYQPKYLLPLFACAQERERNLTFVCGAALESLHWQSLEWRWLDKYVL